MQWCHESRRSIEKAKHSKMNGLHADRVQTDNDFLDTTNRKRAKREKILAVQCIRCSNFQFHFLRYKCKTVIRRCYEHEKKTNNMAFCDLHNRMNSNISGIHAKWLGMHEVDLKYRSIFNTLNGFWLLKTI